jgi:hypothetical protein
MSRDYDAIEINNGSSLSMDLDLKKERKHF